MINITLESNKKQILLSSKDHLSLVRENFSINNPVYSKISYNKFTPRRLYCSTASGKFDIGMTGEIISFCKKENIPYIIDKSVFNSFTPTIYNTDIKALNLELRSYQRESIQLAINNGRGVIVLPTGAGKTLTIATLINSINQTYNNYRYLIVVPSIQLIKQTYSDFIEYGINSSTISKWSGDDTVDPTSSIIIAGLHIMHSQYKNHIELLQSIDVLVIDECHKLRKNNEINNIIKHIPTSHVYGFTGTMPACKLDQWNIIGKIGPILYEKKSLELRDNKQIANIIIQILIINYLKKPTFSAASMHAPTKAFEEETDFLINSAERNKKISQICKNTDKNTLVVCERISHGEALYSYLKDECKDKTVYFIQGSMEVSMREEIRSLMEINHNIVCIAISKIFAEGINIKNLHYIVFAANGKAKIKILQTIGRGVRLHPLKNMLYIFDIADNLKYGNKHLKERIKLYESEKIKFKATEIQL